MLKIKGQAILEYMILFAILIAGLIIANFLIQGKGTQAFYDHFKNCESNILKNP